MGKLLAATVIAVGAAGLMAADDEATKKALKELEGKYMPKALIKGGRPAPAEMIEAVEYALIKEGKITIRKKSGEADEAKFTIDTGHEPPHMDVSPSQGPRKDLKMKGIYRLEKGTLTIILSREGDRPKDFKAEQEHEMKMVFERKKGD